MGGDVVLEPTAHKHPLPAPFSTFARPRCDVEREWKSFSKIMCDLKVEKCSPSTQKNILIYLFWCLHGPHTSQSRRQNQKLTYHANTKTYIESEFRSMLHFILHQSFTQCLVQSRFVSKMERRCPGWKGNHGWRSCTSATRCVHT